MTEIAIDSNNIAEHGVEINIDELLLDTENPRLYAQRREGALDTLQDDELTKLLQKVFHSLMQMVLMLKPAMVQFLPQFNLEQTSSTLED